MSTHLFVKFGITKNFDEMFDVVIAADDDVYSYYLDDLDEEDYPEGVTRDTDIPKLYKDVITGKVPKPEWFKEAEESENMYDYYQPSNNLYLIPKDEQYKSLGNSIVKFLYSTQHEATHD